MSRRDKIVLQFIMVIALATFLFGVWLIVVGIRKPQPGTDQSSPALTNDAPARETPR